MIVFRRLAAVTPLAALACTLALAVVICTATLDSAWAYALARTGALAGLAVLGAAVAGQLERARDLIVPALVFGPLAATACSRASWWPYADMIGMATDVGTSAAAMTLLGVGAGVLHDRRDQIHGVLASALIVGLGTWLMLRLLGFATPELGSYLDLEVEPWMLATVLGFGAIIGAWTWRSHFGFARTVAGTVLGAVAGLTLDAGVSLGTSLVHVVVLALAVGGPVHAGRAAASRLRLAHSMRGAEFA